MFIQCTMFCTEKKRHFEKYLHIQIVSKQIAALSEETNKQLSTMLPLLDLNTHSTLQNYEMLLKNDTSGVNGLQQPP